MDVVGIIAEYNPFHNGHLYQLNVVKKKFPKATIIVVMSGNFLERGEPAILDKWTRAREAILNGVNLVIELPVGFCVQPADRFALGAMRILRDLGVTKLVFGAEHASYDFSRLADLTGTIHGDFSIYNESYAKAYQRIVTQETGLDISNPNDLLGLSYAKANLLLGNFLNLYPIQRQAAAYHDQSLPKDSTIASASAIRSGIFTKKADISKYVPKETLEDIKNNSSLSWQDFWPMLRYRISTSSIEELAQIYAMNEGLEYRIKSKLERLGPKATFEEWISSVKSKRYTYTHLSRIAIMILLHVKNSDIEVIEQFPYIRVLGFDETGKAHLNNIKKAIEFPIIAKVSQKIVKNKLELDHQAGLVYEQFNGSRQEYGRIPFRR